MRRRHADRAASSPARGPAEPGAPAEAGLLRLQRLAGNASVNRLLDEEEPSPVLDVVGKGGGQPLDAGVRAQMEGHLGRDLGDVRVHTDSTAAASARGVDARAYTVGNEIAFDTGVYDPGTQAGRHVLAHELTHVVQQSAGPVEGTPAPGGIQVSDPDDRFEREARAVADSVLEDETESRIS